MFVTEIESALRDGRIDMAVHSAKDLPSTMQADLTIAAFLPRADPRDVLISRDGAATLRRLPSGARVGTSSPRRLCQLRALRPDLDARDVRGNVDTRLRKLHSGEFDALLLAAAGLIRLDRAAEIVEWLDPDLFIPCVGQGALAVQTRASDESLAQFVSGLDDDATRTAVLAERAFLAELGAGCRAAAAAHARIDARGRLRISAMIGETGGGRHVRATRTADASRPEEAGEDVARELLRAGGAAFLGRHDSALRGVTVAVTRPADQARELLDLIRANGGTGVCAPAIAIAPAPDPAALDAALRDIGDADWIVFTSANAVEAVASHLRAMGLALPPVTRIAAVGRATADALAQRLHPAAFVPATASGKALADELPDVVGRRVLFPRGDLATEAVVTTLRARGADVRDVVAYRTIRADGVDDLATRAGRGELDAIVFTSPSAVRFVSQALDACAIAAPDRPLAITIGQSTTEAAETARWTSITQAVTPTVGALIDALERALLHRRSRAVAALPVP